MSDILQALLAILLLASQAADIWTTEYAIRWGCREGNPLMKTPLVRFVAKPLLAILMVCAVLFAPLTWVSGIVFSVLAIGILTVAWRNYQLARTRRQLVLRLNAIARGK